MIDFMATLTTMTWFGYFTCIVDIADANIKTWIVTGASCFAMTELAIQQPVGSFW